MRKIGICGYGYVGKAMTKMLREHYEVYVYDIKQEEMDEVKIKIMRENFNTYFVNNIKDLSICELGVVCVPTPMSEDGSCDTSIVEKTVRELDTDLILIKSTIPPGTTERIKKETKKRVCFSPEFSGESTYWSPYEFDKDMKACPWLIIGGNENDANEILEMLVPILGPTKEYRLTDTKTAELVKYWENTFFALKVTFCNEMYDICEAFGINYWEARDLWLLDPRVNKMHTAVFKNKKGYGGKCFPKDTNGLYNASKEAGYEPQLIGKMIERNNQFVKRNSISTTNNNIII